jgi:hypothetical protein
MAAPSISPVWWWERHGHDDRGVVAYRGRLTTAPQLTARVGFDGWHQARDLEGRRQDPVTILFDLDGLAAHHTVELAFTDGQVWDNNEGADYRLWVRLDPFDSHVHSSHDGDGGLGFGALRTAMASAGVVGAVISWQDNAAVDRLVAPHPELHRIVWVGPGRTGLDELQHRLSNGSRGIKLHPVVDDFLADDHRLDPYMEVAAERRVTVAVHSGPGPSDPKRLARLAARFPTVGFLWYHTYLGIPWGRRRAAHHARQLDNVMLETSWCASWEVERLVSDLGPDRIVFGSDAAIDGPRHFTNHNVEGRQTYRDVMLEIARRFEHDTAYRILAGNARRLFGL